MDNRFYFWYNTRKPKRCANTLRHDDWIRASHKSIVLRAPVTCQHRSFSVSAKNGKPCGNCGGVRWNKDGKCTACKSARDKKYREENKESVALRKKKYQQENKEKVRFGFLRWVSENKEKKAETDRKWAEQNKDKTKANHARWRSKPENAAKVAENSRRWRLDNPEKSKEQETRWRQENPEMSIAKTHRRRANIRGSESRYTAQEWRNLVKKYNNKCLCCGRSDVKLTVDHVIPLSKGGRNDISNIQPLCLSCNDKKGTKKTDYR